MQNIIIDATVVSTHTIGDRVFHQKFGYGHVQKIDGEKLEIHFDKAGLKNIVARFVNASDDIPF